MAICMLERLRTCSIHEELLGSSRQAGTGARIFLNSHCYSVHLERPKKPVSHVGQGEHQQGMTQSSAKSKGRKPGALPFSELFITEPLPEGEAPSTRVFSSVSPFLDMLLQTNHQPFLFLDSRYNQFDNQD